MLNLSQKTVCLRFKAQNKKKFVSKLTSGLKRNAVCGFFFIFKFNTMRRMRSSIRYQCSSVHRILQLVIPLVSRFMWYVCSVVHIPLNSFFPFLKKIGVPQIFRGKKKKFCITFFIFPEICPKFTNARASFETNFFFFFGLIWQGFKIWPPFYCQRCEEKSDPKHRVNYVFLHWNLVKISILKEIQNGKLEILPHWLVQGCHCTNGRKWGKNRKNQLFKKQNKLDMLCSKSTTPAGAIFFCLTSNPLSLKWARCFLIGRGVEANAYVWVTCKNDVT